MLAKKSVDGESDVNRLQHGYVCRRDVQFGAVNEAIYDISILPLMVVDNFGPVRRRQLAVQFSSPYLADQLLIVTMNAG